MSSAPARELIDHTFEVVVAGGAGLRATQGAVGAGLTTACITRCLRPAAMLSSNGSGPQWPGRSMQVAAYRRDCS
ncbi:UNVERIFIED_ORG: succinate dehydrogenase/fumarate reductase flavoprotein subunit [Bradyrhizobium japonicum]